jgi:hypothetical protein
LSVTVSLSESQTNIANQRSLVLWNPHGIGLFLLSGVLQETLTRSPNPSETRINKGKNKKTGEIKGSLRVGAEAPDGCESVMGLWGE